MDVWGVFVGDSTLSYGGFVRNTYYRDYEQFPYGTLEHNATTCTKDPYSRVQEKCKFKTEKQQRKECPFCKEHKKRPLINYMRKRDSRKHHESICEDEEELHEQGVVEEQEVDGEEAERRQQQQHTHHHYHNHHHDGHHVDGTNQNMEEGQRQTSTPIKANN